MPPHLLEENNPVGTMRLATADDGSELAGIYAPYVRDTAVTFETDPPSAEEFARRIETISARYPYIVLENGDGRIDGYAYATRYHERAAYRYCVTTSVYLRPEAAGKGLGRKLYRALFAVLERQGFRNAYAVIALPNPKSVRLHEAFGFENVGVTHTSGYKFGRWIDVVTMEKRFATSLDSPPPIVPANELDRPFLQSILEEHPAT